MAARLGDWVGWRTGAAVLRAYAAILQIEHGGIAESLANLYRLTWDARYLATAERFYHAQRLRSARPGPGRPVRPARATPTSRR